MCIAALPALLSIGQAVAGFAGAQAQSNEQTAAYNRNRVAAIAAANDRYAADNAKAVQLREKASQELLQKQTEALQKRATATVSAGEAGVSGHSVDAVMGDFLRAQGMAQRALQTNLENDVFNVRSDMESTYHRTVSRINSVRPGAKVSPIPFLLQGIGGALKGAA